MEQVSRCQQEEQEDQRKANSRQHLGRAVGRRIQQCGRAHHHFARLFRLRTLHLILRYGDRRCILHAAAQARKATELLLDGRHFFFHGLRVARCVAHDLRQRIAEGVEHRRQADQRAQHQEDRGNRLGHLQPSPEEPDDRAEHQGKQKREHDRQDEACRQVEHAPEEDKKYSDDGPPGAHLNGLLGDEPDIRGNNGFALV